MRTLRPSIGLAVGMAFVVGSLILAAFVKADPDYTHARTTVSAYTVATVGNVPETIAASSTATNVVWIDVTRHSSIDVELNAAHATTNPGLGGVIVAFYRSLDGVTADPTALASMTVIPTGVNSLTEITNLANIGNSGWLKATFQNAATAAVASCSMRIVGKQPWALTYPYGGP